MVTDVVTSLFLRKIKTKLKLPMLALVDSDVWVEDFVCVWVLVFV